MDLDFRSRQLQRRFERGAEAVRAWGPDVGRRYVQRVAALIAAERIEDVYEIRAFDLHPLTGNRSGQHAIRLTGQMRLIITVESPRRVIIEEVTDYHG